MDPAHDVDPRERRAGPLRIAGSLQAPNDLRGAPPWNTRDWLIVAALALGVLIVYGRVTRCGFVLYDDPEYVTDNLHVKMGLTPGAIRWALTTTAVSYWHPLTWLSHMADVQLFGLSPPGHHLTSLLLHAATTVLLYVLFRQATGKVWQSAAIAAMFASHPLRVESVAWVAERKDVLSGMLFVATLLAYVHFSRRPSPGRYATVAAVYGLGLAAKPTLVTLPFVLLLMDYWPLRRLWPEHLPNSGLSPVSPGSPAPSFVPGTLQRLIAEKVPLVILAGACGVLTFLGAKANGSVVALSGNHAVSVSARGWNAVVFYARYLGKMVWPSNLSVFYPYRVSMPIWQIVTAAALLTVVTGAVLLGRRRRYALVGWCWFLGMLIPVIGLVQAGSQAIADRYTYLSGIGLLVAAVWGIADAARTLRLPRTMLAIGAGAVISAWATCTVLQIGYWANDFNLFTHAVKATGDNWLAQEYLGSEAVLRRDDAAAAWHFRESVRLNPEAPYAHYNLANLLYRQGHIDAAIEDYRKTLAADPQFALAYHNLGVIEAQRADYASAIQLFAQTVRLKPDYAEGWLHLGAALAARGEDRKAAEAYRQVQRLKPGARGDG